MKAALKMLIIFLPFFTVGYSIGAQLQTTVGQKDKQFTIEHVKVKVGESIEFLNDDPFFHNVFSLSPAATFDLGSYPKGESRTVTFEEAGEVHVECAIHPRMQMIVEVEE